MRAPKRLSPSLRRRSRPLRAIGFQAVAPSREMPLTSRLDGQLQACRCQPEQNPRLQNTWLTQDGQAATDAPSHACHGSELPHQRSLSATRATVPASHYHLERTRPWAHTATVGAAVPRMAEFREKKLRPLDANSVQRGLQSSTGGDRFPARGSAPAATGRDLSEHLAITAADISDDD